MFATVNVSAGGFYAGAGTENVDFAGIKQEYDLWAGYTLPLGKAKLDIGVVRYGYVDAPVKIDTLEVKAALSGSVGKLGLGVTAYHTGNYFGSSQPATYVEGTASYPLTGKLSMSAAFGHQQIDKLPGYDTWSAGLSYQVLKADTSPTSWPTPNSRRPGAALAGALPSPVFLLRTDHTAQARADHKIQPPPAVNELSEGRGKGRAITFSAQRPLCSPIPNASPSPSPPSIRLRRQATPTMA